MIRRTTPQPHPAAGLFAFYQKRRLVIMGPKGWHHDCGDNSNGGFYSDSESLFLAHLEQCELTVVRYSPEEINAMLEEMRREGGYNDR